MSLTGRYFRVEGDTIIEGPTGLPRAWRNVSGLDMASPKELAALGWLPEDRTGYEPFDPDTQKRTGPVNTVQPDKVVSDYTITAKTAQEIDDENATKAQRELDVLALKALAFGITRVQQDKAGFATTADLAAIRTASINWYKANR